nr:unnamed protein product [Callosobruchus analis]
MIYPDLHDGTESETIENGAENQNENGFSGPTSAASASENGNTQKNVTHSESMETVTPTTPKTTNIFRTPQRCKRKTPGDEKMSTISAAIYKLDEVVQKNNSNADDEFDIFAKHIAIQLRQMPLYDALICQEQIQNIIRQKRLELLRPLQSVTIPTAEFPPSALSPAVTNNMNEEYWSSSASVSIQSRRGQQEDDLHEETSNILTLALRNVLE